ncbi:MAG TPA: DMT family transporter [Symbiobacteriaceae bacterium]|nr:DMT family transporter [Symbiobacteriaceae bacterium]
MRLRTWQADLLLLFVASIWGATFPLVKNATDVTAGGVPTYWFLAARFTLATLILAPMLWRRRARLKPATWAAGGLLGLFLFLGYAFQTIGLGLTTSSKAGFITGLGVVLVPGIALVWLKIRPRPLVWLGVGLALVGLGFLSLDGVTALAWGDFLVLLGAVAFALHMVGISRFGETHDTTLLATIQIGTAALLSWGMHLGTESLPARIDWWGGTGNVGVAVLICGLFATAFAFLLMNVLQPFTTPAHAALIYTTEPIWAAVFSFLLLGERLTTTGYVGALLIVGGMVVAELPIGRSEAVPD